MNKGIDESNILSAQIYAQIPFEILVLKNIPKFDT